MPSKQSRPADASKLSSSEYNSQIDVPEIDLPNWGPKFESLGLRLHIDLHAMVALGGPLGFFRLNPNKGPQSDCMD